MSPRSTSGQANLGLMVHLHCWTRIRVQTWIRIPNPMATLYYAEHVHIVQTRIATPYGISRTQIRVGVRTRFRLQQCK